MLDYRRTEGFVLTCALIQVFITDVILRVYLVCDVLLFCRGMTFGVYQSGVGHQVASVLHDEAPTW